MAPWIRDVEGNNDRLASLHSEIGEQLEDLAQRVDAIHAQVGGSCTDASHISSETIEKLVAEGEQEQSKVKMRSGTHGEKEPFREVSVMLLLLRSSAHGGQVLVELAREKPGGKQQDEVRLPGLKMGGQETLQDAARKLIKEGLNLDEGSLVLDFSHVDFFLEEMMSGTLSGVLTTYRKHIVSGYMNCSDEKILARIGLAKDGTIWRACDKTRGTVYYTWMSEQKASAMKVRLRSDHSATLARQTRATKDSLLWKGVADVAKKVEHIYRDRTLLDFERGMDAVQGLLQAENASVASVLKQSFARRDYVVQHADQLQDFVQTLSEIDRLQGQINPSHLEAVPGLSDRLKRLEVGTSVLADASSLLHDHVAQIAKDYHVAMSGISAQMLVWNSLLDQRYTR
eukprot:CAMPEP_0117462818 /NCGR_PEP_ID=MMETSP0784-20121206/3252_1 /TAXON_ID=39447 /ORGANISM="" /LENGTH=398 /DNA_ID=CAMNT_0005256599 /DNA_START=98 /DNA_END=1294 /DNA_ORIENTATION=+